jgi:preprotein translocase subunit SecA
MRIFAGEWVSNVLAKLGMEEGQAIESKLVSRRIEGAQKKVEERNFDIRKNLLEYDEVMDHQRKRVYGYRQEILDGANCKTRILQMLDDQVNLAVDRFLDDDYGPSSFAEFAANRLGIEFDAADFARSDFTEAEKTARDKAVRMIPTQILEAMDENLSTDVDPREWNWKTISQQVNTRWGLKTTDRQLKQIGRDELAQQLTEMAEKAVAAVDLGDGRPFLDSDWGLRSTCDWARLKFGIKLTPESLAAKDPEEIKAILHDHLLKMYHQKEIEFPVKVGMARFMAERQLQPGGQRYDREGLYDWAKQRFPGAADTLFEEDFRTQSRSRLQERLLEVSRKYFPKAPQEQIDGKVEETFQGTRLSEPEDARELAEWVKGEYQLDVPEAALTGVTQEAARQVLWNAFDERYRPEMRGMERNLLLGRLDQSWKNHLYTMDHLRSTIGLRSYAQVDPKTEYKREGMKEFDTMWEGVQEKVTEAVFRMEEEEGFQESIWAIGAAVHESAPRPMPVADEHSIRGQQEAAIAGSQKGEKKPEPIRNRGERVGRNDPCPCGSGKKYKNCHMKIAAG